MSREHWLEDSIEDSLDDFEGSYWDQPVEEYVPVKDKRVLKQERHEAKLRRQAKELQEELDSRQ